MPPSQLKQLKAALHQQRQSKEKPRKKASQKPLPTAQERSHALRTKTLLPEIRNRRKVGGIRDRRFGEDDPTLAPEERMLQRFAAESQRKKNRNTFNLEDVSDDEGIALTHGGKPLTDDYTYEPGIDEDSDADLDPAEQRKRKLEEIQGQAAQEAAEGLEPDRKKTKREVMNEVIAKSKLYKHERQQAKEDDEAVRDELDQGLPDLLAALRGGKGQPSASHGVLSLAAREQEYDRRVREMIQDKRAAPSDRTKTAEEKAEDEAARLEDLEQKRQRRMRGEDVSGSESDNGEDNETQPEDLVAEDDAIPDEAEEFGLRATSGKAVQEVEDEDDFFIEEDLVATDSEIDEDDISSLGEDSEPEDTNAVEDEDDEEFLRDILPMKPGENPEKTNPDAANSKTLAYTYPCPQTHEELLDVFREVDDADVPVAVQRIRALYHPQLHADNKTKLANFSSALVDHISFASTTRPPLPLAVSESLIRHIHSLTRSHGDAVAKAFRRHLHSMQKSNSPPTPGDLVILTAISTIYPTSDHFHQVVTPAITVIARYLGLVLTPCSSTEASSRGAYLVALALRYQRLSKRYIPEIVRFSQSALSSRHTLSDSNLVAQHIANLRAMLDLWSSETAIIEIISPSITSLLSSPATAKHLNSFAPAKALATRLQITLSQSRLARRPLELHHHRPLPIKTAIPRFEGESFNPSAHYDPDKDRAEEARLRKEYKREKKGALRELRRDAEFVAREQLREKKERDRAYVENERKIIGEIQREEGQAKNEYEREKRKRKAKS